MKRKEIVQISGTLFLAMLLFSCSPRSKPNTIMPLEAPSQVTLFPEKDGWRANWDKLIEVSRKEGLVVIYGPGAYEVRLGLAEPFRKKYGVRVETLALRGAEIVPKIFTERKAGLYIPDLSLAGSTTFVGGLKPGGALDPIEPTLMLPELIDPFEIKKVWWGGELKYVDKERLILPFSLYSSPGLAINTELVKQGDINSYWDLLNPRWKGKILLNDPTLLGTGSKWFAMIGRKIVSWDYLRELAKQDPVVIRDQRLQAEWLARGRYPVATSPNTSYMRPFFEAGAPLQWVEAKEGSYLTSGGGNIVLMNKSPHPNAAKLFINWLLTKEGQTLWTLTKQIQSSRLDVPTNHLDPVTIRNPEVKYFFSEEESLLLLEEENYRLAREIFSPLIK